MEENYDHLYKLEKKGVLKLRLGKLHLMEEANKLHLLIDTYCLWLQR